MVMLMTAARGKSATTAPAGRKSANAGEGGGGGDAVAVEQRRLHQVLPRRVHMTQRGQRLNGDNAHRRQQAGGGGQCCGGSIGLVVVLLLL